MQLTEKKVPMGAPIPKPQILSPLSLLSPKPPAVQFSPRARIRNGAQLSLEVVLGFRVGYSRKIRPELS